MSNITNEIVTFISCFTLLGRNNLIESQTNLEKVADYCEGNYHQASEKRAALEETKNYTTQSLASVAYQINTLAFSFLQMLDLQAGQMAEMESQINHINQMVHIHKEKVARREIGVLTTNKSSTRQYKILAPANQERPIKYVRRPIDFSALDDIGHGVRIQNENPRQKQRVTNQGSSSSLASIGHGQSMMGTLRGSHSPVPPAPTSKPPTPPQMRAMGTGSLTKGSREYRTPPAVAPPQVPSNYAPNYPLGHSRRSERNSSSASGSYGTLPMPMSHHHVTGTMNSQYAPSSQTPPQVGMVHPLTHSHRESASSIVYAPGLERQRSYSNPRKFVYLQGTCHTVTDVFSVLAPPSPGMLNNMTMDMPLPLSNYGVTGLQQQGNRASINPSPPPPPMPDSDDLMGGGRMSSSSIRRVLPSEGDLPGWVPKDYLEKVVAVYDYYADKEDELSFQENSIIYVLRKNDDGWWEGIMDGITGLFPGNYVEPCP